MFGTDQLLVDVPGEVGGGLGVLRCAVDDQLLSRVIPAHIQGHAIIVIHNHLIMQYKAFNQYIYMM